MFRIVAYLQAKCTFAFINDNVCTTRQILQVSHIISISYKTFKRVSQIIVNLMQIELNLMHMDSNFLLVYKPIGFMNCLRFIIDYKLINLNDFFFIQIYSLYNLIFKSSIISQKVQISCET